jgi:peptidoglycan/LPS O-acetylase OafA/YrhL
VTAHVEAVPDGTLAAPHPAELDGSPAHEINPSVPRRLPQLDGVRALAVVLVVLDHTGGPMFGDIGQHGVTLFFVLSAYLITGILLKGRNEPPRRAITTFYARRALRIFPAYYALLAVLLIVNVPGLRSAWPWYAFYAANWRAALVGHWDVGVGHLWTLAIEEQFYLTWPLVVFLVPTRHLGRVCVALASAAVVARGMLAATSVEPIRVITPTIAVLDAFAIGGLLAWYQHTRQVSRVGLRWALGAGLVIVAHSMWLHNAHRGYILWLATERLGVSLISVSLLAAAAAGGLTRVFAWRPVRAIGTISYGVYLWHLPIAFGVTVWAARNPMAHPIASGGLAMVILVSASTLGVASVSWIALERPLNRLKRLVPYATHG